MNVLDQTSLKHYFIVALSLFTLALAGCGTTDDGADNGNGPADTGAADTANSNEDAGAADTQTSEDTATAEDTSAPEDTGAGGEDGGSSPNDVVVGKCTSDQYCLTLLKDQLGGFQTAFCDVATGECKKVTKAGFCANDGDCDDGSECTTDKCDIATNKCVSTAVPNCCTGKVSLLNARFEQKSFEGFVGSMKPEVGNVSWNLSTNRAHTGKNSLYLGNSCNTYDTSMTVDSGCKPGGSAKPFEANLLSQEVALPKNKPAIAHFWIWIEAEPKFTANGICPNGCKAGTTCVKVDNTQSLCVPENDVLSVFVQTNAPSPDPVWESSSIDKSTSGWLHVAINLAPYQKKDQATAIKLRWNFKANNAKNNFEGVYIDDVVIETLCVSNGTTCTKSQGCADDKNPCTDDACTFFANNGNQGLCFSDKEPSCCINVADCNDLNDCTVDKCSIASGASQGVCDNQPDANNVQCCKPENTFKDNFESGSLAAWTSADSNSKSVKWRINDKEASTSAKSLYFGKSTLNGYDDPTLGNAGPKGHFCSPELSIVQGTVYDVLSFDLKLQTEWSGKPAANYKNPLCPSSVPPETCKTLPKVDHFSVDVFDAGQYKQAWSSDNIKGTTEGKWQPIVVNLDQFQGKKVKVCFSFDAGDGGANNAGGVWVDNVSIDVACNKTICATDKDQVCIDKCGKCGVPSCVQGDCECTPIAGCCEKDGDCDDADTCTNDKCTIKDGVGSCGYSLTTPSCCSDKTGDKAVFGEDFESNNKMPSGWKVTVPKGKNILGLPYATDKGWMISIKAKPGSGNYSLYFGGKDGTLNSAKGTTPAGSVTGPEFTVPTNGTTLVSFDVFLSTEWDDFTFKKPPLAIDQMFVHAIDVEEKDAAKQKVLLWDSYAIEGTTKGKWVPVVMAFPASLANKKVRLELSFDCGNDNMNKGEGAFVDNLKVETLCKKPACVSDVDCAPQTPDTCKKYWCGKDKAGAFACQTEFKPGKGCCTNSIALPNETAESGNFGKWSGKPFTGSVKWQVISHKYLVGKKEIYFGNSSAWNYADGSGKMCKQTSECPSNTGELCVGPPAAKKCYKAVTSELLSDPFDLDPDVKKIASFKFKAYLDLETNWEELEIWVSWVENPTGVSPKAKKEKLWEKANIKDMPVADYKKVIDRTLDLSKYKPYKNIQLKFVFNSGDPNNNDMNEGIFLDDLIVEEICQ
ncbi:MAG TPA: hypothetical protein DCQ06_13195 [Myxococcales bacterium]|nr:hypothetical protein [Myxococcales bacterium]